MIIEKCTLSLPIYYLKDFYHFNKSNLHKKNSLRFDNPKIIFPNKNNKIILRSFKKFNSGWYLFGLFHSGENNRCYGRIICGNSYFFQGRPMFSNRRRWRIVRINRKKHMQIILENINHPFKLNEIWLIKVPFLEAWRRIRNRTKQFYSFIPGYFANKKEIKNIWRIYNREISQINQRLFKFELWQEKVEKKLIKELSSNNYSKKINFVIQDPNDPYIVNKDTFVILKKFEDKIPQWTEKVLESFIIKDKNLKLIFGDEDFLDKFGKRYNPHFKGAWNRELFWSNPGIFNSWIISSDIWNKTINLFEKTKTNKNLFNIILNITFNLEKANNIGAIKHLPLILYHNHQKNKSFLLESLKQNNNFLLNFINKNNNDLGFLKKISLDKKRAINNLYWDLERDVLLSIIIPIRDNVDLLIACLNSIYKNPPGLKYEIFIINNDSKEANTLKFLSELKSENKEFSKKVIDYPGEFNFSKMNNDVAKIVNGEVILFLNNDIEFISRNWGYELASNALRPNIGFVGAKLLYDDNTIQHSGVILGIGGVAGHALKYLNKDDDYFFSKIFCAQEYSALTGACLAISRTNWHKLKGFDEKSLKINYNDVDVCLEARLIGLRNIYLPNIQAYHHESKTRGKPLGIALKNWKKERNFMLKKWGETIKNDPHYHPFLSLYKEDFSKTMNYKKINLRSSLLSKE